MSFAFVAVSDVWIQNRCRRGCRGNRPFTASGSTLHGFVVRKSCDTNTVRHVPTNAGVSAFFASIATAVSLPSGKRTEGLHSSAKVTRTQRVSRDLRAVGTLRFLQITNMKERNRTAGDSALGLEYTAVRILT